MRRRGAQGGGGGGAVRRLRRLLRVRGRRLRLRQLDLQLRRGVRGRGAARHPAAVRHRASSPRAPAGCTLRPEPKNPQALRRGQPAREELQAQVQAQRARPWLQGQPEGVVRALTAHAIVPLLASRCLPQAAPADPDARNPTEVFDRFAEQLLHCPGPPGAPWAFPIANNIILFMAFWYGRAGGLTSRFGGFRPGQCSSRAPCSRRRRPRSRWTWPRGSWTGRRGCGTGPSRRRARPRSSVSRCWAPAAR
jgi:hypothetical protein